jgi:hypothetical protein
VFVTKLTFSMFQLSWFNFKVSNTRIQGSLPRLFVFKTPTELDQQIWSVCQLLLQLRNLILTLNCWKANSNRWLQGKNIERNCFPTSNIYLQTLLLNVCWIFTLELKKLKSYSTSVTYLRKRKKLKKHF